ncbi:hypothetical protein MnTg02_03230 [bacterium MnTg02]|nr:hypothetical protein MnTg02_03230 [bacterium MnTg02]
MDRICAAHAVQHLGSLDAFQHRQCLICRCRRQAEGNILQDLNQYATKAEGDEFAETWIGDRPDNHLLRAGGQHLLHLNTGDRGIGLIGGRIRNDSVIGSASFIGARNADLHAARFRFVQNVRRYDFQDHGIAHAIGEAGSLVRRGRKPFLRQGDGVSIANFFGLRCRECCSPICFDLLKDGLHHSLVVFHSVLSQ